MKKSKPFVKKGMYVEIKDSSGKLAVRFQQTSDICKQRFILKIFQLYNIAPKDGYTIYVDGRVFDW